MDFTVRQWSYYNLLGSIVGSEAAWISDAQFHHDRSSKAFWLVGLVSAGRQMSMSIGVHVSVVVYVVVSDQVL